MTRLLRPGQDPSFYKTDDYNTITASLSCLPIKDDSSILDKVEKGFRESKQFKDGFTLNENRIISNAGEERRLQSK